MTVTEIEPVEVTEESLDDGIYHELCCRDNMHGICGTELIGADDPTAKTDCIVCLDLSAANDAHQARLGHRHCPIDEFKICPAKKGTES